MDARDVARVLTKAAAFDQRTVGDGDILAWLDAIGDLDVVDALAAVTRHYRDSTDFLRPAHLRRQVAGIVQERANADRERDAAERRSGALPAISPGPTTDRSAEIAAFVAQVRDVLPPGDPAKLRGPAWLRRHGSRQLRAASDHPIREVS